MEENKKTFFHISYNEGSKYEQSISDNIIKLISNEPNVKISYEKDDKDFVWFKIIKGENSKETNRYNRLSQEFLKSDNNTVFWSNQPPSLIFRLAKDDNINNKDYDEFINIFIEECVHNWSLIPHDNFCQLLLTALS